MHHIKDQFCIICGLNEAALTSSCYGRMLEVQTAHLVAANLYDFTGIWKVKVNGNWEPATISNFVETLRKYKEIINER